ncbi:adenylate/guanylate cyclase domain-containing protein [Chondrinema litorale]|uniref:adenylate/guanylate cyclase domain-containing protein n=1 Tax=Chondrinema litorale TaxID=2994555 RepID=UPI002542A88F|nr:adenylate/guanylate cyclase domain-containing protein [Chondrinema litorale]UZR96388.1 adenylate/guanylate cyclase domain-containing protein [Chondrinema litorale]
MKKKFEYTTFANRFVARFPLLSYMGIQMNFWIIANCLLVTIMYLHAQIISQIYKVLIAISFISFIKMAVITGALYGLILGQTGYYFDKYIFKKLPIGKIILFKTITSLLLLIFLLWLLRVELFDLFVPVTFYESGFMISDTTWDNLFYLLMIYYFFMTLIISFINQVNKKYGPGVVVPLLLGKYRHPKEEVRIFMFMDLKSSTATAEKLGHLKYSAFIRDCFDDINEVILPNYAQVYQYVGDEIVLMWPENEGLKNQHCIKFFFACKKEFQKRADYYTTNYGTIPEFKAGLHLGKVTAVEIGEIKKDIAYHGDTLNTAARIQSVCNEYDKDFLVSEYLLERIASCQNIIIESMGMILLRGKTNKVGIASINGIETEQEKLT